MLRRVEMKKKKTKLVKVYQVIVESVWNNLHCTGFYYKLDDAIKDVNAYTETDEIKLKKGDLKEYASTTSMCLI